MPPVPPELIPDAAESYELPDLEDLPTEGDVTGAGAEPQTVQRGIILGIYTDKRERLMWQAACTRAQAILHNGDATPTDRNWAVAVLNRMDEMKHGPLKKHHSPDVPTFMVKVVSVSGEYVNVRPHEQMRPEDLQKELEEGRKKTPKEYAPDYSKINRPRGTGKPTDFAIRRVR